VPRLVQGEWTAHEGHQVTLLFTIFQNGGNLTGSAKSLGPPAEDESQSIAGKVTNDAILLTVHWQSGAVGEYSGTFNLGGRITGITVDTHTWENVLAWASESEFNAFVEG
jgi:hypothetical protein